MRPFDVNASSGQRSYSTREIKLDTAVTNLIIEGVASAVFCDVNSTGFCTMEIDTGFDASIDPLLVTAGFMYEDQEGGFSRLKINAPAQEGKFIRLVLLNGARIRPGDSPNAENSTVSVVQTMGQFFGATTPVTARVDLAAPGIGVTTLTFINANAFKRGYIVRDFFSKLKVTAGELDVALYASRNIPGTMSATIQGAILLARSFVDAARAVNIVDKQINRQVAPGFGLHLIYSGSAAIAGGSLETCTSFEALP